MTAWLVRRVAASIAIVFAVVTFTFALVHLAPGRPFVPGAETPMDPAVVAELRRQFGLDQPLLVQYVKYLGALARGQLGQSFALHRPVADVLTDALPNTLILTGAALGIELLLGLALGVYQAVYARRLPDVGLGYATLFLNSVPVFWLGLLLLLVFGEWLRWFPVGGVVNPVVHDSLPWAGRVADRLWHLALPALTLGCVGAAGTARYQRAAVLEVIGQDYVRTARAKGLREQAVLLRHALKNAMIPVLTTVGIVFGSLLSGAVLTETIFGWPGLGRYATTSAVSLDLPAVMGVTLVAAVVYPVVNMLVDIGYHMLDPRIRVG